MGQVLLSKANCKLGMVIQPTDKATILGYIDSAQQYVITQLPTPEFNYTVVLAPNLQSMIITDDHLDQFFIVADSFI
jgi:hypothetical protein